MIDITKPIRLRNGNPAELLVVLPPNKMIDNDEILVVLTCVDDDIMRCVQTYRADGMFFPTQGPTDWDIVNI